MCAQLLPVLPTLHILYLSVSNVWPKCTMEEQSYEKKNSKRSTLKSNALNPLMPGGNKKVTHT